MSSSSSQGDEFYTEPADVEGLPVNPEHDVPPHIIFVSQQLILTLLCADAEKLNLSASEVCKLASSATRAARAVRAN